MSEEEYRQMVPSAPSPILLGSLHLVTSTVRKRPPATGWRQRRSAEAHGLPLRLDDGDDAVLVAGVGLAGVLRGDPVDDLPCVVAVEPFHDPAADDDGLVRVVGRHRGERHPRVTAQVAGLARLRAGEEDDLVAVGADPERDGVRRAVRQDRGEVGQRGAVEYAAYVGFEHGRLLAVSRAVSDGVYPVSGDDSTGAATAAARRAWSASEPGHGLETVPRLIQDGLG